MRFMRPPKRSSHYHNTSNMASHPVQPRGSHPHSIVSINIRRVVSMRSKNFCRPCPPLPFSASVINAAEKRFANHVLNLLHSQPLPNSAQSRQSGDSSRPLKPPSKREQLIFGVG